MKKLTKREYQIDFITLTKLFVNDHISVDDYKTSLELLCNNYRKDYKNYGNEA